MGAEVQEISGYQWPLRRPLIVFKAMRLTRPEEQEGKALDDTAKKDRAGRSIA